jgi:hypothetical protein
VELCWLRSIPGAAFLLAMAGGTLTQALAVASLGRFWAAVKTLAQRVEKEVELK